MQLCSNCGLSKENKDLICLQEGNNESSKAIWCSTCKPEYAAELAMMWNSVGMKLNGIVVKEI